MSNDNHNPKIPGYPRGNPDIVQAGKATRFAPGRSGNPSGRPSTRVLTEELRKGLASAIPAELASELRLASDSTFAEAIAARLIRLAAAGQIAAIREVYERTEGKPPKEVVSDDEKAFETGFRYGPALAATAIEKLLTEETEKPDAEKSLGQIAG